ncbi:MAG TPA: copper resistance protein CopC [Candidatus Limnocylindria bacterium]|nr:copper resistance protein CopC [Candidatus Limnocylindria bacterium]
MPKTDRLRRARRLGLVVGLALGLQASVLLFPLPVLGHALLVDADPAPNSVVPASPPRLALFFSEAIDPETMSVRVVDSEGQPVIGMGAPRLDATGQVLTADLPELDPDTYTVDYTVVSAVDGHRATQVFAFVVDPTGTEPPPSLPLPTEPTTPPDPATIAARWVATLAGLLLAGSAAVWLYHRRWIGAESRAPVPKRMLAGLALTALVSLLAYVAWSATVAFAGGHGGHVDGLPLDPVAPFGWTPFAIALRISLAGAVAAVVLALTAGPAAGRRRLAAIGVSAGLVLLGMSLTGHAAALGGPVGAAVDILHLLAIAAWLGALPAIVLLARRSGGGRSAFTVHARVALVAAPLVVLTGLANSPLVVDEPRELAAAGYGNLLLAKAGLVALALGLGAANYFLARGGDPRRLAILAGGEAAVAVVAVLVGTTMVSIPPAADRPPSTVDPRLGVAHLYTEGGESALHGIVDLPEPGVQSYSFAVADPETGAGRQDVAQVTVTFVPPPGSALPPATVLASPTQQPWIWTLRGAYTPVVGTWDLEIRVRRGRLVEDRMAVPLDVRQVLRARPLPPPTTGSQALGALAAPTMGLPRGTAGWAVPVGLLGVAGVVMAIERRRGLSVPRRGALWAVRLALVGVGVMVGVSLLARDVVAVTNRPPAAWVAAANPLADDLAAIPAGDDVYRANCASCHGATGAGDGPAADDLARPPADLAGIVPYRLDGELAWIVGAGVAGTQMPAFGSTLLEGERWELVSFLRSRWPYQAPQASPGSSP